MHDIDMYIGPYALIIVPMRYSKQDSCQSPDECPNINNETEYCPKCGIKASVRFFEVVTGTPDVDYLGDICENQLENDLICVPLYDYNKNYIKCVIMSNLVDFDTQLSFGDLQSDDDIRSIDISIIKSEINNFSQRFEHHLAVLSNELKCKIEVKWGVFQRAY